MCGTQSSTVSLFTRISVVIGDALVLAVTWIKTARGYRDAHRLNIKAPLATILFRDGEMNESVSRSFSVY